MLKKLVFFALFFASPVFMNVFAQSEIPAFDFLRVETGAKASSLAGAFDTYTDDPNAMFYNPGSLSTITNNKVSAGFGKYLLDMNFGTLAYAQKYKDLGWFGIGVKYFDYGSFDRADETGTPTGETFNANDLMVSVGYGNYIYEKINYGITIKYIYSGIAEYKSSAIAMDFGMQYHMPASQLSLSFGVLNLGAQLSSYISTKEKLPLDIRVGVSKRLEHTPVRLNVTFAKLNESREKLVQHFKAFSIGAEFIFSDYVSARLGYDNESRQDMKLGTSLGISGFSTGLGIRFAEKYVFDYSLNSLGKVGSTHRVNLGYIFN
ncbi:MAG TPA: type IX secretion system protein PorQ [Ignavibacteria bacterium]|nr:type IX secretion system protein PorQ [Ignavibacteria bacterium]HRE12066.1 type IX secretion system protein PorQ [Ignavibacteria bacterium]HRF65247.1 type IX secretion system protein PorQ [Ignavibacteria bacterium]HRJ05235.1 type IX secretion system protein PorQ [Ignavibacteria bacterium]HRJ85645.1 type IX secretion system protein PorQ [Ignavibacteria bacterium]